MKLTPIQHQHAFWLVLTRTGTHRWELLAWPGETGFQPRLFLTRREARLWVRKTGLHILRVVRCHMAYRV